MIVSVVHKVATVTPEAQKFIAYVKTAKARTLLTGLGAVPITE